MNSKNNLIKNITIEHNTVFMMNNSFRERKNSTGLQEYEYSLDKFGCDANSWAVFEIVIYITLLLRKHSTAGVLATSEQQPDLQLQQQLAAR